MAISISKRKQKNKSHYFLKLVLLLVTVVLFSQFKLMNQTNEATSTASSFDEDANKPHIMPFLNVSRTTVVTSNKTNGKNNDDDKNNDNDNGNKKKQKHRNCPFRDSSIVESIYVYPSPGDLDFKGDILSDYARENNNNKSTAIKDFPWIANDVYTKLNRIGPYDTKSQMVQYNTELMVRDIVTHPDSCLRTYDPEKATLFYVPYLPAAELHNGTLFAPVSNSIYGKALIDVITENKFDDWEKLFGWTSKYYQRRNGSDHIMVYSEPMHGLWHPRSRRGNFHFLRSQYQTYSPIVISVELSTTFINEYPMCARKNILMPYPNTDGRWFNGGLDKETITVMAKSAIRKVSDSSGAIHSEIKLEQREQESQLESSLSNTNITAPLRVIGYFYSGGNHGTCKHLRQSMKSDFQCSLSGKFVKKHQISNNYASAYRQATFCPAPGGDSPSAKRNFDALIAGCIPVVLSKDYVWPFTSEFDRSAMNGDNSDVNGGSNSSSGNIAVLNPYDFSITLQAADYQDAKFDPQTCKFLSEDRNSTNSTDQQQQTPADDLQSILEAISPEELERLRRGVAKAAYTYSYYRKRPDLPDNPLLEGVLPDGGAAHMLVRALEERSSGALWGACESELKGKEISKDKVNAFKC